MLMSTLVSRRPIVITSLFTAFFAATSTWAKSVDVDHSAHIKPVDQGAANLCWLAAAAMMQSSRNRGASVSMALVANQLGAPFKELFDRGQVNSNAGGLSLKQVSSLASRLGLQTEGLKSMNLDWWVRRIETGPVWIAGYTQNAVMGHVVLIAGIHGDTSKPSELIVTVIDPAGGRTQKRSFASLISFYEGLASSATKAMAPQLLFY